MLRHSPKRVARVTHNPVYAGIIIFGYLAQYDERADPVLRKYKHSGVDLASLYPEMEVRPLADGQVWYMSRSPGRKDWFAIIRHKLSGIGVCYGRYGHLAAGGIIPRRWQKMRKEDRIGLIDPVYKHLHFDLMRVFWPFYFPTTERLIKRYFIDPTPWIIGEPAR
jgi:murein DD-endopeptidase MepM/ murein hydrolase activator NlpD